MTPKKSIILWLTVFGIACLLPNAWACSCMPQHPQDHYCNADFGKFTLNHLNIMKLWIFLFMQISVKRINNKLV